MTLMPEDIQSKQFHVRFRGFDVEEVDGFLEQVAENFLMLLEENRTAKAKIEAMTQELEGFRQDESSFKSAILSAQKVGDEMKRKSRSDANRMLALATAEVTQLKDKANSEIAALEERVEQLRGMQSKIMADLRGVLNNYLDQLNTSELNARSGGPNPLVMPTPQAPPPASKKADVDPSPLYESIAVDDEEDPWLAQAEAELHSEDVEADNESFSGPAIGGLDLEEEPRVTIPALDDEVMFSLEDPLDQEVGRPLRRR